jgi:hypothetical protein
LDVSLLCRLLAFKPSPDAYGNKSGARSLEFADFARVSTKQHHWFV